MFLKNWSRCTTFQWAAAASADEPILPASPERPQTGGSVFGDQCSPISDTTILSSLATGCDLMDHVTTQLPMALGAAGLAAILYTVVAAGMS